MQPKKGSPEWKEMRAQQNKRIKENMLKDQKKKAELIDVSETPLIASGLLFASALPQSALLYPIIWADPCSDLFFKSLDMIVYWIAAQNATEAAAGVSLGYIDYKILYGNPKDMVEAMRKKRLAFAKFAYFTAISGLFLLDTPTGNCVLPLIIGSGYTAMKLGTQLGYNLTPEQFYMPRTYLAIYNLLILIAIWYKLRQARREK